MKDFNIKVEKDEDGAITFYAVDGKGERIEDGNLFAIYEGNLCLAPDINPDLGLSLDKHGMINILIHPVVMAREISQRIEGLQETQNKCNCENCSPKQEEISKHLH